MGVGRVTRRAKEVFISKSVRTCRVSASTVVTLHYCCHPALSRMTVYRNQFSRSSQPWSSCGPAPVLLHCICRLLMLLTAPPPARKCHRVWVLLRPPRFGGGAKMQTIIRSKAEDCRRRERLPRSFMSARACFPLRRVGMVLSSLYVPLSRGGRRLRPAARRA